MIRALLVDDEEPARDRLRGMLAEHDDVRVVGEAGDGEEAIKRIDELSPDLVFLDIQMPGRSGMEVIASLPPPRPRVIFCTAFDQYAIDAFDHHALDYLMKPLSRDRLARAIERVRRSAPSVDGLALEVAQASETQARLLPQTLPAMASLDYAGACRAAKDVGGDYYDFLPIGGGRLGIAVGDISGKGLYAGLLMAGLQARVQTLAPVHGGQVERLAAEVNRVMHASTDSNRYATLFYGVYDDAERTLSYVNAGHNPPLLLRPDGAARLSPTGTVIGLMPEARYRKELVRLAPGETLVIFTDGVTDMVNERDEPFGEERLEDLVRRHGHRAAREILDLVLAELDTFRGGVKPHDDVTLVVAKVT
jgi:sigma-B regulation protein RsbU (phosphoserine phosphatase)